MKKLLILLLTSMLTLAACQTQDTPDDVTEKKLQVVASTTMLADLVKQIGQDKVEVTMLFGPGIDPHLVLPTGGDTKVIQDADLVIFSGLHLEAQFGQVLSAYSSKTVQVGEMLDANKLLYVEDDDGQEVDPHFWFSVPLWQEAARVVGDTLKARDSENADFYETNTAAYIDELNDLHEWILSRVAELSEDKKVLVTAHDAFNYFASTYGFEVAAIAGISTEGEVTTEDVNGVATVIVEKSVKSIFIESSVPQTTVDAVIAEVRRRGSDVAIGEELFSDAIGIGEYAEYINAIKHNVNSIIDGLK